MLEDLQILIIDDQKSMRKILRQLLNQEGMRKISEAVNGKDALEHISSPHSPVPDVILCDLHMDEMDGMEFSNRLRRNKKTTPVLMLTGEEDHFVRDVAKQAGATKILSKPISSQDLRNEIAAAVGYLEHA